MFVPGKPLAMSALWRVPTAFLLAVAPAAGAMLCTCDAPAGSQYRCGSIGGTEYVCPVGVCCSLLGQCTTDSTLCWSGGGMPNSRFSYNTQGACQGVDASNGGNYCASTTPAPDDSDHSDRSDGSGSNKEFPLWALGPLLSGVFVVLVTVALMLYCMCRKSNEPAFVNKAYMGRIFAAPASSKNAGELFLNIGFNAKGGQLFPSFPPHLQGHVSSKDYDALVHELQAVFEVHNTGNSASMMMLVMMPCCLFTGITCCWCMYMKRKVDELDKLLREVVDRHSRRSFGGRLRLERLDMAQRTGNRPEDMAFDSAGFRLERQDSDEGLVPMWPPLGYNLIISKGGWTQAVSGGGAAAPRPHTMGVQDV